MNKRLGLLAAGGLAVALVAVGGTALAASTGPVSSTGTITGCYSNTEVSGAHAVDLQDGGTTCPKGWSAISWNQTGPQGPAGPAGPAGPQGAAGTPGATGATGATGASGATGPEGIPGTSLTVSGAPTSQCPNGGIEIGDASTPDAGVICNGAPGTDGINGTNGATGATGATGPQGAPGTVTSLDQLNGTSCDGGAGTTQVAYSSSGAVTITCVIPVTPPPTSPTPTPNNTCGSAINLNQALGDGVNVVTGINAGTSAAWYEIAVTAASSATLGGIPVGSAEAGTDVMNVYTDCAGSLATGGGDVTSYAFTSGTYYLQVIEGPDGTDGGFELSLS